MKPSHALPSLLLFLAIGLPAQTKATRLRGTVQDANTKKPIAGATVTASGDTGQQEEVTDDNGYFRLLIEGVAPGDIVRLRVVKPGYTVYDRQVVTTEEIPVTVELRRSSSPAPPSPPHPPAVSTDPATARYIQELTTQQNPVFRLNALDVVLRSAAKDSAALNAIAAAVNDADYRVRQAAVYDLGRIGQSSPNVLTALRVALDDIEPLVQRAAVDSLGRLSLGKDTLNALFVVMGAPPRVNAFAAAALNNHHVDDPRVRRALIYAATVNYQADAADSLVNNPHGDGVLPDLFTALGTPPKINIGAMKILQRIGSEDPRLIAALSFEATLDNNTDAIKALSRHSANKDAVEGLLKAVGTPGDKNDAALKALCNMGIDDPRLYDVLLTRADTYNAATISLLLKMSPPSQTLTASLLQYISKSLELPQNFRAQIYIDILLKSGGAAGRQALHHLLASSDAQHQALLALAWLEVEHNAAQELLPDLHLPDTEDYLVKLSKTPAQGAVSLPEYDTSKYVCNEGPSLRATMGLAMLNLDQKHHPTATLIRNINSEMDTCAAYAAAAVGWFGPSILKAASSTLVHSARCAPNFSWKVSSDTLAQIGDEKTIAQLQISNNSYAPDEFICDGDPNHLGHVQDDLVIRIRKRLNAGK